MQRTSWVSLPLLLLIILGFSSSPARPHGEGDAALWPEIEPFETGHLRVSNLHQIFYELCGNPNGKPVFVLHGGPGSGCSPHMRRFFNPERFLIVLHDQRGAGRSIPYAEIRQNTTEHLVRDIERLRRHLDLQEVILFGGSWGTTLGLAYAEVYPERVSGMVLRGVFTGTKSEIDYFYHGGVRTHFPDAYDRMLGSLPDPDRRPLPAYFLELIRSEDPSERDRYSRVWAAYEIKICGLAVPDEQIAGILEESDPYAFALLENYYMANDCFLEEDQLLKNAWKIPDIPITIVNGRYDAVCPPVTAYRLHQAIPGSRLIIAESAGHWMGEKPIEQALLEAMKDFE